MASDEPRSAVFAPTAHLRALFVRPAGELGPLDGLRAISVVWVLSFHAAWYSLRYIPTETYVAMLRDPAMLPLWRGDFGVDVFFVLSGFLIAGLLLDEEARTGTVQIGRFYLRRWLRLWPSLAVVALVDRLTLGENTEYLWATLVYLSDFVSVWHVFMAWSWSLAIEVKFYLVAPCLLCVTPRARTTTVVIALVASCVVAAVVCAQGGFRAADVEIVITRRPSQWARAFDALYCKPWMRVGPLLAGVLAAIWYRRKGAMELLARAETSATIGLALALGVAALSTQWPLVEHAPRHVELAYLATFRAAFGLAISFVLLLSLSTHAVGSRLGRLLSARGLVPIARLGYAAYLVNPIVVMTLHPVLAPRALAWGWTPIALFWPIDLVCTFAAALLLHVFVEAPFMQLRPRRVR